MASKRKKGTQQQKTQRRLTARERAMRRQRLVFGIIGVLIILSFVVTLWSP